MADESSSKTGKVAFSKVHIELQRKDIGPFRGLFVGSKVHLLIVGEIRAKSEDRVDHESPNAQHGTVDVSVKRLLVSGNNEFTDLFKDELDG